MPRALDTASFRFGSETEASDVIARLRKRRTTVQSRTRRVTQSQLDTADRRLQRAGLDLALEASTKGRARFVLRDAATPDRPITAEIARPRSRRHLSADLPAGPLRDRLAPVIGVRALLPLVEIRRHVVPVAVHNRDAKTVVRISVVEQWATPLPSLKTFGGKPHDEPQHLTGRIEVTGVLGYPKSFARVAKVLDGQNGVVRTSEGATDEAMRALGVDPRLLATPWARAKLKRNQRAGVVAAQILHALAETAQANLPGTLDDLDTEFLHQFRVAIRRSRSVLRELKSVFPPTERREQADSLRWMQAITGPTRDLDVQLLEWHELISHVTGPRRSDLRPVHGLLVARRNAAVRTMKRTLRSSEFSARWSSWRDFLMDDDLAHGRKQIGGLARDRIRSVYRRMLRDGTAIDDSSPAQALHDLRKRGKELRYLLEFFGGMYSASRVRPMVASLRGLQDVLGRHQDREVQAEHLRAWAPDLADRPGGPDALLALGSVIDRLETEQMEARSQFAERFEAFAAMRVP